MSDRGDIVYVVERFPERSQTFIQNELRALHGVGVRPRVFALYRPTAVDPTAGALAFERLPSTAADVRQAAAALVRVVRRHPRGVARMVIFAARRPGRMQAHALGKAVLLLDRLGCHRPRRIHAHFARASASTAMLAARALGVPFSFTAHAMDIFFQPFDVDRKLSVADVAVTVCDYNRRYIEQRWPGLGRLAVVPCGVAPDAFSRRRPYRRDPFTVVAVGRLVEKKGFHVLVEACRLLRRRDLQLRCRIVGDGPERDRLTSAVASAGLDDVVSLEPFAAPAEIRAALEDASVFCLPCIVAADGDRDSQPLVIKEAMAMQVPVVATDEVGNPEMVDGTTGRLVPAGDPAALADALADLAAADEAALVEMGRLARRRVEERFSLSHQVSVLLTWWGERQITR